MVSNCTSRQCAALGLCSAAVLGFLTLFGVRYYFRSYTIGPLSSSASLNEQAAVTGALGAAASVFTVATVILLYRFVGCPAGEDPLPEQKKTLLAP